MVIQGCHWSTKTRSGRSRGRARPSQSAAMPSSSVTIRQGRRGGARQGAAAIPTRGGRTFQRMRGGQRRHLPVQRIHWRLERGGPGQEILHRADHQLRMLVVVLQQRIHQPAQDHARAVELHEGLVAGGVDQPVAQVVVEPPARRLGVEGLVPHRDRRQAGCWGARAHEPRAVFHVVAADEDRQRQAVVAEHPGLMLHAAMIYGAEGENNVQRLAALMRPLPVAPLPGGGGALVQPVHQDDVTRCLLAPLSRLVPGMPVVTAAEIRRLTEDKAFDIGPMRTMLGVQPMPLAEGLARTFAAR